MATFSKDELSGKLYELNTVELRSALRWLNNTVKATVSPASMLSTMRFEDAHRRVMNDYSLDDIELAYNHITQKEKPIPPSPTSDERIDKKAALLKELLGGSDTDLEPRFRAITDRLNTQSGRIDQLVTNTTNAIIQTKNDFAQHTALITKMRDQLETLPPNLADELATLKKLAPTNLTITFPLERNRSVDLGVTHKAVPKLIKYVAAGVHVFLTGPAGSGKSHAGEQVAKALDLKFFATSVCSQTTETKFLGYMDANGNYRPTQYREAYEFGGLFLIDEIDNGNSNILAVLNMSLSGTDCAFPDKMVKRHPKFRCLAAGNTWGTGKTIQYVGRNALDAATLNRFVMVEFDYDEALETKITGLPTWSSYVQTCRKIIHDQGINFLITPRASLHGAAALRAGVSIKDVLNDILFPNLDPAIRQRMPSCPAISV